jgi:glycosyltransferase involved in cell wall biosynthesis
LRIVVHDYSGHPGQVNLSRALAQRGNEVVHQYCPSFTTGTGAVEVVPGDPAGFSVEGVRLQRSFARYSFALRIWQEVHYGFLAAKAIRRNRPDVALLSNIPLLSLFVTTGMLRRSKIPLVFWQQDVYSAAIYAAAERRLGALGRLIGSIAIRIERHVARHSASVVPIDTSFTPVLRGWGIPNEKIHVVPNWAPIAEIPQRPKDNGWAAAHDLPPDPIVLYTGTLGLKHDPSLLADAAAALSGQCSVVVVSEGMGRTVLEEARTEHGLDNLRLFDFQPYDDLPDIMGSADVLVALLEPHASVYSVPSKVLTYLCAGRPIVAVIPPENSVAGVVREHDAGRLVTPGDGAGLVATLEALLADPALRDTLGANARKYAEQTFDTEAIGARFEKILSEAAGQMA